MPVQKKTTRPRREGRLYPYGVGDGTRDPRREASSDDGDAEDDGADNGPDDGAAADNDSDTSESSEDADDGNTYNNSRELYIGNPGVGGEQVISVLPDQAIKLVITSNEPAKPAVKEHPQERITKFWANFEPEFLGGITQILPDTVCETAAPTRKKPQDNSPQAVLSYENARNNCIKSVKRIIRECRSNNQKYTDPHFDLERDLKVTGNRDCLYGLTSWDYTKNPGDVKRVSDIYEHPQFFKDGAGFDDIVQGALGDCWFLAGLSAITSFQELLRKVCVIQDQDVGVYGFVFHRDGDWHPCIIDDKIYLSAPSFDESGETVLEQYGVKQKEQEKMYLDTLQKGSKALYFASCRDENETWVPLLEKAFAKAHGDFSALDGGQVGEALEDLTGGITTEIYTTNILSKEDFWRDLRRLGKDFIFSCHVSIFSNWRGVSDDSEVYVRDQRRKGIVEGHAYSVLDTYEGYGQRLVKIRNPWGEREWTGPWSDGSKEWTPEWLYRLEHKFGDDGVFWMNYEDMLKRYKYMDRTRLFGPEWHVAQEWTSIQVPWNSRDYQSTTFSIDVPKETDAVIALSQLDDRYFQGFQGRYDFTISFRVQKFGEDEDEDDYFARSPVNYELSRSTNVEVHLEEGKYTVLVKVEAYKTTRKDIEKIIRKNIRRRDKITQMATLYDLAYRKGKPPPEKKEEPKPAEVKPAEAVPQPAPPQENKVEDKPENQTAEPDKKEDNNEDKKEDKKEEPPVEEKAKDDRPTETKEEPKPEEKQKEAVPGEKTENPQEQQQQQEQSGGFLPVMSSNNVYSSETTGQKIVPDEDDPNRNPWNASCVLGLRVYSKLPELKLRVVRPGDKSEGATLDRDDIAKAPLVEAENAQSEQKAE